VGRINGEQRYLSVHSADGRSDKIRMTNPPARWSSMMMIERESIRSLIRSAGLNVEPSPQRALFRRQEMPAGAGASA
jgi:hypothetical protein